MTLMLTYLFGALAISFLCSIMEAVLLSTPMSFITMKEEQGVKTASLMKEYKNNIVFFQEKYNIDIYDVKKYAYIVKGTCTLKDREGNTSEKDFELIVVQITGIKFWMYVNEDTVFEPGRDIKTIAENDVSVYAALMYEDVKDCRVKITDTVKDDSETIVYGKVYITNHYGDKYNSTFKVTYDYDYDSLTYEKTDICIDMPVKER